MRTLYRLMLLLTVFTFIAIAATPQQAQAAAALTIQPVTWNVAGLDSNKVNAPNTPDTFMVGARVCNTGDAAATNVNVSFVWASTATPPLVDYLNLSSSSSSTLFRPSLAAGACADFYYNVVVTRSSAAYNATRRYHITATADGGLSVNTPTPRELFVEYLVSQNRNAVVSISVQDDLTGVTLPSTGSPPVYDVVVGNTYRIVLNSKTATNGYEQLEAFMNFPNTLFQIESIQTSYTAPAGGTNDKFYADACGWDNVPTSPTYRSCIGPANYAGGKAGGSIQTIYRVKILAVGTTDLYTLIYDFSGSSFHYNSDYGAATNGIRMRANSPTAVTLVDFSGHSSDRGVQLQWQTATELNTTGFYLYRSTTPDRSQALRITPDLIPATGDGLTGAMYSWLDTDVNASVTYYYWLHEVESGGLTSEYGPTSVRMPGDHLLYMPIMFR